MTSNSISSAFFLASSYNQAVEESLERKPRIVRVARKLRPDVLSERDFPTHYRMSKDCFEKLVTELLACPSAPMHLPRPGKDHCTSTVLLPEERIAIGIWYMATPDSYRSIARSFNMRKSTIHDCVTATCLMLFEIERRHISWSSPEEQLQDMATFWSESGVPGVVGAVDGTLIPIPRPFSSILAAKPYYCRKKCYAMNVMLTVNSREEVIHYSVGSPGSYHDQRVYRRSTLPGLISDLQPERHVLGDSGYTLERGLVVPYLDRGALTEEQKRFNHKHSSCRMVVENANGRLKQKWRRLYDLQVKTVSRAKLIIRACLILHNFVLQGDTTDSRAQNYLGPRITDTDERRKRNKLMGALA